MQLYLHYLPIFLYEQVSLKLYLLKFVRDRRRWMNWLFEVKKRYNLSVLNYMVTSNHIHLLVYDLGFKAKGRTIAGSKGHYHLRENISDFGNTSL